jgi:hypothetical protein
VEKERRRRLEWEKEREKRGLEWKREREEVPWAPRTERMGCVTSLTMPRRTCSDIITAACDWCRILWVSDWTLPQVSRVGSSLREGVSWSEELRKVSVLNPNKLLVQSA